MKKIILLFLILFFLTGCGGTLHKFRQQSKLSNANDMLRKGNKEPAINLLKEISDEKGVTGVTDEAMFRLALTYLSSSTAIERLQKSEEILIKLQKEYPASLWTIQSYPLIDLITKVRTGNISRIEVKQELNSLKQENKKLKLSIERLKTLDIEMEERHRP